MKWNIKKSEPKVNLTIRVNPSELKALDDILKQQGITRSAFLQSIISQYIEEMETVNHETDVGQQTD